MHEIKVLGTGCVNCIKLEKLCNEVVAENKWAADIEKISSYEEFEKYGIWLTPGLVVNGKVLVQGKIPTKSTLYHWLKNAIE